MANSNRCLFFLLICVVTWVPTVVRADFAYSLNVQVVQVCDDAGSVCTNLGPSGGSDLSYLYGTDVQSIWSQADLEINYLPVVQWNNTAAMRLTLSERTDLYDDNWSNGTAPPMIPADAVQIFFVQDHPGTGYFETGDTGWVGNPLSNPATSARSAGNAQLFISGQYSSNGRAVMASEGFAATQLSGTLAHEIGHLLGLRHIEDIPTQSNGTTQDPNFTLAAGTPNLMWETALAYNTNLTIVQNFALNSQQTDAAIFNGLRLDPTGNGTGALQAVPEPSAMWLFSFATLVSVVGKVWTNLLRRSRN